MEFISSLVDLVFPSRCVVCERIDSKPLCDSCLPALPYVSGPVCSRCGQPLRGAEKVSGKRGAAGAGCPGCHSRSLPYSLCRSLLLFEDSGRRVVHALKYENGRRLAPILAAESVRRLEPALFGVDAITFVPLHRRKQAERGYNQAQLIARELGRLLDLPVKRLLRQKKPTKDQSRLSAKERAQNVKGVYETTKTTRKGTRRASDLPPAGDGGHALPHTLLLVDDVFTTGATIFECATKLQEAGAAEVRVLTAARDVLES